MEMKDNVWATDVDSLIGILKVNLEHLIKVNAENLWKEIDENIKPKVNELWEMTGLGLRDLRRKIEKLEAVAELAFKVESFKKEFKAPHKCPICEGKAIFSHCFPGQSVATSMDCKSCKGEGIVWG